jgi:hypothetical protein
VTIVNEACTINVLLPLALDLTSVINYDHSGAPSCGITYNHHSDDSRGIMYDHNMFIIQTLVMVGALLLQTHTQFQTYSNSVMLGWCLPFSKPF